MIGSGAQVGMNALIFKAMDETLRRPMALKFLTNEAPRGPQALNLRIRKFGRCSGRRTAFMEPA